MAVKKSKLYQAIWDCCNKLRGGMDATQYKDYILTILFIKYVSDRAKIKKDENLVEVPEGGSFDDLLALSNKKDIGEKANIVFAKLAEKNDFDFSVVDFNDDRKLGTGNEKVSRLTKLFQIFNRPEFNLSQNRINDDDILGDAYEYLMRKFATESGKSKGQFYTPSLASVLVSKLLQFKKNMDAEASIYDPTCGSGSMLLKAYAEAFKVSGNELTLYGQEKEIATANLARMNMFIHKAPTASIEIGDTLTSPKFTRDGFVMQHDFIVANPPFSLKEWATGLVNAGRTMTAEDDPYRRFNYGVPPAQNGDFAFLSHIIASLKPTGTAIVILPHGPLFRGGAEAFIRRNLIERGYVKSIISLPANLFYGTGIPTVMLIISKQDADTRKGIFMIDASKGFKKEGSKNELRVRDIHKIVDAYQNGTDTEGFSRMVLNAELEANEFNLNIPRYIDSGEPEEQHDIRAHLYGGIPNGEIDLLSTYWQTMPSLRQELFTPHSVDYSSVKVETSEIRDIILNHQEFKAFGAKASAKFENWVYDAANTLWQINKTTNPKAMIEDLGEHLNLEICDMPMFNYYEFYQDLMDYWETTMQDDVYLIIQDGWKATKELIEPDLIATQYYRVELDTLMELEATIEQAGREREELEEEHEGEGSLLEEARGDAERVTMASAKARLKAIKGQHDAYEEQQVLEELMRLMEREATLKAHYKRDKAVLDTLVDNHYTAMTEEDVMEVMINFKWMGHMRECLNSHLDHLTQTMTTDISNLCEKYAESEMDLNKSLAELEATVMEHLKSMGISQENADV